MATDAPAGLTPEQRAALPGLVAAATRDPKEADYWEHLAICKAFDTLRALAPGLARALLAAEATVARLERIEAAALEFRDAEVAWSASERHNLDPYWRMLHARDRFRAALREAPAGREEG